MSTPSRAPDRLLTRKIGALEIRRLRGHHVQARIDDRAEQARIGEIGAREVRPHQPGRVEIGAGKVGAGEVGADQLRAEQLRAAQIGLAEIETGQVEAGQVEAGKAGRLGAGRRGDRRADGVGGQWRGRAFGRPVASGALGSRDLAVVHTLLVSRLAAQLLLRGEGRTIRLRLAECMR